MKFNERFKLREVTLNITNGCNLACTYCFGTSKNGKNMAIENGIEILEKCYQNHLKAREENNYETLFVNFFGGEPFLNFELMESLMKYSREMKYDITFGVTTNLTILTEHMIDVIEDYELGILVSIDGVKEIHDRNRCNSFDTVKKNVQKLLDRGLGYLLEARLTVMPKDTPLLLESVQTVFEMGIDNIAPVCVTDTEWKDVDFYEFEKSLKKLWKWVIEKYNDETNKRNLSVKMVEDYLEKVLILPLNEYETHTCTAGGPTCCSIGVTGDILPCHQRHIIKYGYDELVFGNIFEDDEMKDIQFNDGTIHGAFNCDECVAKSICKGGCPSENFTQNGSGNIMNETQCRVLQTLVKVALDNQVELMTSTNIRSHRLNILVQNLKLFHQLFTSVLGNEIGSKEFLATMMKFYEKLADTQDVLLPAFRESIYNVLNKLVNICKDLDKDVTDADTRNPENG